MKAIQKEGKELEKSIKPIKDQLQTMGTAMVAVGGAVVGSFVAMAKSTADYGDKLNDARQRTGATVQDLAKLGFAAEQSGSSFEGMSTGLKFLAKNMEDASSGGKKQEQAFKSLGISVTTTTGKMRPANEVFLDVADRFSRMEDGADKTALAMKIFGKSGADLIPTLNAGRQGLEEMGRAAERAGVVIGGDAAKAGDEFNDRLAELQASVKGISLTIGSVFLPVLTTLITRMTSLANSVRKWADEHPGLIKLIGGVAAALAGTGGLLLGMAGVLTILPKLSTAFTLLTGPVGLTVAAFAGLITGIVYFRNEIASGLLKSLSLAVEGFSTFIGFASRMADAVGLSGLSGKLKTLQDSTYNTASGLTQMGDSFLETTGVTIGNTQAVTDAIATAKQFTFELGANQEAMEKASEAAAKLSNFLRGAEWNLSVPISNIGSAMALIDTRVNVLTPKVAALFGPAISDVELLGIAMSNIDKMRDTGAKQDAAMSAARAKDTAKAGADLNKVMESGRKIIDSFVDDMSKMFIGAIVHGKSFWEAFKGFGSNAIAAMADTFLKQMMRSFLDPLASRLGKIMGGIGKGSDVGGGGGGGFLKGDWIGLAIAGIAAIGAALSSMIGQLRRQANEFVQGIQNPMTSAVTDLFNAMEAARAAGTLTAAQTTEARRAIEKMWADFQAHAASAGVVGQQALATMTPFIHSWGAWLNELDAAALALEEAAAAARAVADAQKRIAEIDEEVKTVSEQLAAALIQKLDHLDNAIGHSQKSIADWTAQIQDLDGDIADQVRHLKDAAYWQKQYDDAIQESADRLKALSDQRASIEEQIASLTIQTERERLQGIIDFSGSESAVRDAEAALNAFNKQIRLQEEAEHIAQLGELQKQLAGVILQQKSAEEAYAQASVAAQSAIDAEQQMTLARIASLEAQRADVLASIEVERQRIAALQADQAATVALMEAMGVSRTDELTNINRTIAALMKRGESLEAEKNSLLALAQSAEIASSRFASLAAQLAATPTVAPPASRPPSAVPTPTTSAPTRSPSYLPPAPINFGSIGGMDIFGSMAAGRRFDMGTPYVPETGLALVHKGERIIPADQNRGGGSPIFNIYQQPGESTEELARRIMSYLRTSGDPRAEFQRIIGVRT